MDRARIAKLNPLRVTAGDTELVVSADDATSIQKVIRNDRQCELTLRRCDGISQGRNEDARLALPSKLLGMEGRCWTKQGEAEHGEQEETESQDVFP